MINVRRHNPALEKRLLLPIEAADGPALLALLAGLSNAERRTAGFLLADTLLPACPEDRFWTLFRDLVTAAPKAHLGTFLKAAVRLYRAGNLRFDHESFREYARSAAGEIDKRKILEAFLPQVTDADDAARLLQAVVPESPATVLTLLLKTGTPVAYFHLFRRLQAGDAPPVVLRQYCIALMKKGDRLSFNLASILQQYFDLKNLPGTFSLQLHPYELHRLDGTYETFRKVLLQI